MNKYNFSIITAWHDGKLRAYLPESGRLIYEVPHAHHLDATAVVLTDSNRFLADLYQHLIINFSLFKQRE